LQLHLAVHVIIVQVPLRYIVQNASSQVYIVQSNSSHRMKK
jgi:hypothetical protein